MTSRERVLAYALLGVLGVGGAGVAFHLAFWQPLQDLRRNLDDKTARVADMLDRLLAAADESR